MVIQQNYIYKELKQNNQMNKQKQLTFLNIYKYMDRKIVLNILLYQKRIDIQRENFIELVEMRLLFNFILCIQKIQYKAFSERCLNRFTCTECDIELYPCVYPLSCGKGMVVNVFQKSTCTYLMKLNNQEVIDPTSKGNLARFINHFPIVYVIINEDEELTFDYQFDVFHNPLTKCLCRGMGGIFRKYDIYKMMKSLEKQTIREYLQQQQVNKLEDDIHYNKKDDLDNNISDLPIPSKNIKSTGTSLNNLDQFTKQSIEFYPQNNGKLQQMQSIVDVAQQKI